MTDPTPRPEADCADRVPARPFGSAESPEPAGEFRPASSGGSAGQAGPSGEPVKGGQPGDLSWPENPVQSESLSRPENSVRPESAIRPGNTGHAGARDRPERRSSPREPAQSGQVSGDPAVCDCLATDSAATDSAGRDSRVRAGGSPVSCSAFEGQPSARLTVLSGPSAVGKSTVIEAIRRHSPQVWLSVSVTTRRPRPGEVHGREYFFVSEDEFREMAATGQLLEWARYTGNYYGTPRGPVAARLAAGLPALLEVDVVGARQVRAAVPGALLVFLAPPSWDELVRRLTGRGTESPEVIRQRLDAAKDELQAENEFDVTLVNTSVKDVCAQLVALLTAEPVRLSACDQEGRLWQVLRRLRESSTRRSTSCSTWLTASTAS